MYFSSAEKQEGVHGSPQFSLGLCTRIGCHVTMATSPEAELGVPCSTERENGKFAESPVGLLISLGAVAQNYSDPALFQETAGVLRFSHISPFLFFMKKCLEIFLFAAVTFLSDYF
jgi:hypothetical protein